MLLLQQMMILFFYMLLGFCGSRKGALRETAAKNLSWIVVEIANPALLINSAISGESKPSGAALLAAAVIAVLISTVQFLLAQAVPVLFRVQQQDSAVYKLLTMFNNIGFMGFPVVAAVYGNDALIYAAIFTLPFNLLVYTYGINLLSPREGGFHWKKILNTGVITCLIAVFLYLVPVPVPGIVRTIASGLGALTGPLSMMVIGISLSRISIRDMFLDRRLLAFSGMKLLLIPVIGTFLIRSFVSNELLVSVCMIMLATPAASMVAMLSQQYDSNVELASKGVALTTILSVLTIPLVSAIVM